MSAGTLAQQSVRFRGGLEDGAASILRLTGSSVGIDAFCMFDPQQARVVDVAVGRVGLMWLPASRRILWSSLRQVG